MEKQAIGPLAATLISTLTPIVIDKLSEKISTGETVSTDQIIDETAAEQGIEVTPDMRVQLTTEIQKQQQTVPQTPEQTIPSETPAAATPAAASMTASEGQRELLTDLNYKYSKQNLELTEALKVWKEANLNPTMIRAQIKDDINYNISLADAKSIQKIGSQIIDNMESLLYGEDYTNTTLEKLKNQNSIKFTPPVRASVERIGQNLYRTKRAGILWKIDMKVMDNGEQIPYLVRVETVEAGEEDNNRKE